MKGLTSLRGLAKGMKGLEGGTQGSEVGTERARERRQGRVQPREEQVKGCGDPVDMATGQISCRDRRRSARRAAAGLPARVACSSYRTGGWFGPSWTSTIDQRLRLDETGSCSSPRTACSSLSRPAPGAVPSPAPRGPSWPLSWNGAPGGELTVHRAGDRHTLHFGRCPVARPTALPLAAITDRNGNTITFNVRRAGPPSRSPIPAATASR